MLQWVLCLRDFALQGGILSLSDEFIGNQDMSSFSVCIEESSPHMLINN
ncbi:hypothetical protein APHCRT_1008 [Anaplasma phagocytophilum str. CRT53-1]|uniref:Uncharacterized protein n=1 Tax=Anaplasma phagocytophilum str. CRT53-1 TaxID=1359157 RepID=A0A0F3PUQ5_ANAPH|nr:hypothetical protein [Anaplasma phagocytophilum]KJV84003.1 hypothetical protein APHCRT_1015 [Anaplasma phagocytophilum str. CRT53-1]KJV85646.1 hypothetical protein APHCRT_1008 [Anaplasma phagocytophilum str. CRT53-1]